MINIQARVSTYTDGDGLTHITDGETAKRRILGESLNAHGLGRNQLDDGSIIRPTSYQNRTIVCTRLGMYLLDKLGVGFDRLAGAAIYLLDELGELASDVRRVAVQDWSVTSADLARVIENDDLGDEGFGRLWWVVLLVAADVTTTNFLDGNTLDVEADIVTGLAFSELFVMHFDGPDLSSHTSGRKGDNHSGLDGASLDTTDWYSANTTNLVDVLERKTERLVGRT